MGEAIGVASGFDDGAVEGESVAIRIAPTTGTLVPIAGHRCTLRAGARRLDELAMYVAAQGVDFQVNNSLGL